MNNPLPERAAQPRMKVRVPNASSKKNDVIIKIKHCHVVWLNLPTNPGLDSGR